MRPADGHAPEGQSRDRAEREPSEHPGTDRAANRTGGSAHFLARRSNAVAVLVHRPSAFRPGRNPTPSQLAERRGARVRSRSFCIAQRTRPELHHGEAQHQVERKRDRTGHANRERYSMPPVPSFHRYRLPAPVAGVTSG
jgi:hypothetical protein